MIYTSGNLTIDNGVWTNKKSIGKLNVYKDGDTSNPNITIDSSDFDTLASQINNANTKVDNILTSIGVEGGNKSLTDLDAGSVMLAPDGKIKSSSKKSNLVGQVFHGYLASEVGVDCSNATVLADNLSEGIAAYDANGTLITGTGVDNVNNYNLGYADGVANALNSANCVYNIGHKHSSACYKLVEDYCNTPMYSLGNNNEQGWYYYRCSRCGQECDEYHYNSWGGLCHRITGNHNVLNCTKEENTVLKTITLSG